MFQNKEFDILVNRYRENKLAHAYLIETNNYDLALKDLITFIKMINCPNDYSAECTKCNLCNLINKGNLPNLKIIEPDGANIKKGQIETLKESFATIPVYSKYNVYIIKNAEKLNSSSANSMLKFVEEPTDGIIGFFLTNNKNVMMDTIKSRCELLMLNYHINSIMEYLEISAETYENYIKTIKAYLEKIETNELINNKVELLTIYPERQDISNIFQIILTIYNANFLKQNNKEYDEFLINIYEINEKNTKLIKKLNIIANFIENLSYNVNIEQALDKFVIEMRDN